MKITCRPAEEKDAEQFTDWVQNTPSNRLDPDIATYPSLHTTAVDKDGETLAYVPFHPVIVLESLAQKPGITKREYVCAVLKVQDLIEQVAKNYGMAEVWWECSDMPLIALAKRHGYEVIKTTVLRKKVGR